MRSERGQAAVEWVALVLVAALALGALVAVVPASDGRSLGGFLAHRLVCAVKGDCGGGDDALVAAYGAEDAELVRRHLPALVFEPGERQIPVDWRECRQVACASVADDRDLDGHRSTAGRRATVFTRLIDHDGRRYIQYWTYYPDSNTTFAGSDRLWEASGATAIGPALRLAALLKTGKTRYPGFHPDDWEAVAVRIDADGRAATRVTSHGHWQWCKRSRCRGQWGPSTGWARVSRGSHSGHVPVDGDRPLLPGRDLRERTATSEGIRLVPLETIDRRGYRRLDPGISPPWLKDAYRNPESGGS